jgi:hypothetical protein
MQVTVKNPPKFNPIELTITIESQEEIDGLWWRLNAPDSLIEDWAKRYYKQILTSEWKTIPNLVSFKTLVLFQAIDTLIKGKDK